ncbi:MAG: hypothetical protein HQ523_01760 [Lentisphaerae bacterium]|nr:hypothetical protein [Lentisphaerota bacterium]
MTDTPQPPPAREAPAALLVYLRDEQTRRCDTMRVEAGERIREIEVDCRTQKEHLLEAGRRTFVALRRSVTTSVAGPARREVDAVAASKMGDAVEQILADCRARLREFAAGPVFPSVLELLVSEAVAVARDVLQVSADREVTGRLHAGPHDVIACRGVVSSHGLAIEVVSDESVWGGVELWVAADTYRIRNTLESRMARQDMALRMVATQRIHHGLADRTDGQGQPLVDDAMAPQGTESTEKA